MSHTFTIQDCDPLLAQLLAAVSKFLRHFATSPLCISLEALPDDGGFRAKAEVYKDTPGPLVHFLGGIIDLSCGKFVLGTQKRRSGIYWFDFLTYAQQGAVQGEEVTAEMLKVVIEEFKLRGRTTEEEFWETLLDVRAKEPRVVGSLLRSYLAEPEDRRASLRGRLPAPSSWTRLFFGQELDQEIDFPTAFLSGQRVPTVAGKTGATSFLQLLVETLRSIRLHRALEASEFGALSCGVVLRDPGLLRSARRIDSSLYSIANVMDLLEERCPRPFSMLLFQEAPKRMSAFLEKMGLLRVLTEQDSFFVERKLCSPLSKHFLVNRGFLPTERAFSLSAELASAAETLGEVLTAGGAAND